MVLGPGRELEGLGQLVEFWGAAGSQSPGLVIRGCLLRNVPKIGCSLVERDIGLGVGELIGFGVARFDWVGVVEKEDWGWAGAHGDRCDGELVGA